MLEDIGIVGYNRVSASSVTDIILACNTLYTALENTSYTQAGEMLVYGNC